MVWFSYHGGHSGEFCNHAVSTLEEVVNTAIEKGFTHYGLTEHCPRYRTEDLYKGEEAIGVAGLISLFDGYVKRALELQKTYSDKIELLVGFESETLPPQKWLKAMQDIKNAYPFDYMVGSVHDICGRWIDYSPQDTAMLEHDIGGPQALQFAYFESVTHMVENLRPQVVAHLDLVRKYQGADFQFSTNVFHAIETTLEAIKANQCVIEVNCAAYRNGFGSVYPLQQILRRAHDMGIDVTLGDDSHGCNTVGVDLDKSLQAIAAAGYQSAVYLTRKNGWQKANLNEIAPKI